MLTAEQRKLLEPFGNELSNWEIRIAEMDDAKIGDLEAACDAVSSTNVWYCIYDAAKILKGIIQSRRNWAKKANAG